MKKKKNIKKMLIILFIIIILVLIYLLQFFSNKNQFDDILFLKLFSKYSNINVKKENIKNNQYFFDISYKNTQLKDINLLESHNTMVYEKIAPGTQGNFSIVLKSNKKSRYNIKFESENEKPINLQFSAFSDGEIIVSNKNSLEELSNHLNGIIEKNQIKVIIINWIWNYETDEFQDIQDTKDSQKIRQYKFNIKAIGEEI